MGDDRTMVLPAMRAASTSDTRAPVAPAGRLLAGRWLVHERIGQGGMCDVHRATDTRHGAVVALKLLRQGANDASAIGRLRHEWVVGRELEHPSLVRVHDFGLDGADAFLTMELLDGVDLRRRSARFVPVATALRWVAHTCVALGQLHGKGLVHGDVKPGNLFLETCGRVRLMDYGLVTRGAGSDRFAPSAIAGTPQYMAPEQVSGRGVLSPSTDLYALGTVAFELLAGCLPYPDEQVERLLRAKMERAAPDVRLLRPELSAGVGAFLARLLERDPARRPRDTAEARALMIPLWKAAAAQESREGGPAARS